MTGAGLCGSKESHECLPRGKQRQKHLGCIPFLFPCCSRELDCGAARYEQVPVGNARAAGESFTHYASPSNLSVSVVLIILKRGLYRKRMTQGAPLSTGSLSRGPNSQS